MLQATRLTWVCLFAATAAAWAQAPAAMLAPGTLIRVELQKKVDTKKAKVGDAVVVKLNETVKQDGATLLPKNSLLVGEVTEVAPGSSSTPAKLGILFDRATDKKGAVLLHLRAAIVKIMPVDSNGASMLSRPTEMGGNGTATVMDPGNPAYANMDRASNGTPVEYSVMETANGSGADLGGVISSVGGNFDLDEDTHVQVRVLH